MSRRRILSAAGAAGAAALAGCSSDATSGDDTGPGSGSGGDDPCDLGGDPAAFAPGDEPYPFHFEYPDTWERYNEDITDYESGIQAQFGHAAWGSAGSSYPVNLLVQQHKRPITDDEAAANWATTFGNAEEIDWTFTYDGSEITVYESSASNEQTVQWRFLLPAPGVDGVYGIMVQAGDSRYERTCLDAITAIAKETVESFTPNEAYSPER